MKINLKYAAALAAATATAGAANGALVAFAGDTTIAGGQGAFDAASGYGGDMQDIVSTAFDQAFLSSISTANGAFLMSPTHQKRTIGLSWGTWSHGYTGEIFWSNGAATATYTMPTGTGAYDMYVEPNPFELISFTVTATDSTGASATTTITASGSSGASHVGFYTTGGESIVDVTVVGGPDAFGSPTDFAIGEMRYAKVPAPGALALLGAAGLVSRRRRR